MTAVLWAETGHCKEEGGYEQSTRGRGAQSKRVPLLTPQKHVHTWLSNSISFNVSWLDGMPKLFGQTSVYLPISLSLWASLLSSRQNSVELYLQACLLKRVIRVWNNGADAQIQCFDNTAHLESNVLGFSINWNLKWTARGKCYCSKVAMET